MEKVELVNRKSKYKSALFYLKILKKYFYVFIASVIVSFFSSFMVCRFGMPTKYYSTGFFGLNQVVNVTVSNATIEILCSDSTCGNVYEKLIVDGVKHSNGDEISLNELKNGISGVHNDKSLLIMVKFVNNDSSIVSKVVNYFLDDVMEHISDETQYGSFRFVFIGEYANNAFAEANKKPMIIFLSIVSGLALSFVGILLYDSYFGRIVDSENLTKYGDVFEMTTSDSFKYEIAVCDGLENFELAIPLDTVSQLKEIRTYKEMWLIVKKGTRISIFKKKADLISSNITYKICLMNQPKK